MGPKSCRGEITMRGRIDRTAAYESRELAAAALPRLLGSPHWQYRLSHAEPLPSCTVRMVEMEKPADVHPFAGVSLEDFSEALRRRLYDQVVADYFAPELVSTGDVLHTRGGGCSRHDARRPERRTAAVPLGPGPARDDALSRDP